MFNGMQFCDESVFVFGPFEFHPTQRLLMRAGQQLRIGSRAREILLALLQSAGTIVKKGALVARVWPDIVVEEGTLRVHIAALRKLLRDGQNGQRYIETITGIGYRFSAPVTRPAKRALSHSVTTEEPAGLPLELERAIAATANQLQPSHAHGIRCIDLGSIPDGALIAAALASALGIATSAHNPLPCDRRGLPRNCYVIMQSTGMSPAAACTRKSNAHHERATSDELSSSGPRN